MTAHKFTIEGPPVGYYVQGARPDWARLKKYRAWKAHVQTCAALAGIKLPLTASRDRPLQIATHAYFKTRVHADPENVHKGIVDALFWHPEKGKRGSDKHVGGEFNHPLYDKQRPRVFVVIEGAK